MALAAVHRLSASTFRSRVLLSAWRHAPVCINSAAGIARREISRQAYSDMHRRSIEDPDSFWGEAAQDIVWTKLYEKVLDTGNAPFYRWFVGGELNMCYNCVDRHVDEGNGAWNALIYDSPITGKKQTYTFLELQSEVAKLAGVLVELGVEKGDRVVIYMPMIPEAVFAMLACARVGAIHCVVFGGFAAKELGVRIEDAEPKVILTASCGIEPKGPIAYKPLLEGALKRVEHKPAACVVKQRPQLSATLKDGDLDWDDLVSAAVPRDCVPVSSTDGLYILYTSGSTGKPKGVLRDTAGHAVALRWTMNNFMETMPGEVYWAASDIGWIVGHSYIVYAPLLQGSATVLFEGKPVRMPDAGVFWRVIEEHQVNNLFTAPTALRAIRKEDQNCDLVKDYNMSSLRNVFLAGERCDPATSNFFQQALGVRIVDNWWQTETGHSICGLQYDDVGSKAGSTSLPLPGYDVSVRLTDGSQATFPNQPGDLVVKLPLPPGNFPRLYKDDKGYLDKYMSKYPGYYETGDSGVIDKDGYVTVLERTDDVMNVAAHRLSCGTMEAVIKAHPDINDCAVVGVSDELKGEVPLALIVLQDGVDRPVEDILVEVNQKVRADIGAIATLAAVGIVEDLPKTRSGKVLRKNIRGIAGGKDVAVPGTIDRYEAIDVVTATLKELGYPKIDPSPLTEVGTV